LKVQLIYKLFFLLTKRRNFRKLYYNNWIPQRRWRKE